MGYSYWFGIFDDITKSGQPVEASIVAKKRKVIPVSNETDTRNVLW